MIGSKILDGSGNITAFNISTIRVERDLIARNELLTGIFLELQGMDQAREAGRPLQIGCGSRFDVVFRVLGEFSELSGRPATLAQFVTIIRLLLLARVEYAGEQALQIMEQLYRLTPGGCRNSDMGLPRPGDEERSKLRVHKEVVTEQEGSAPKTTIVLTIPEGAEMMGRVIGAVGANIKALGKLFVPNANVHFWIQKWAPPADLETLLANNPVEVAPATPLDQPATEAVVAPDEAKEAPTTPVVEPPAKKVARKRATKVSVKA
jgi:hypothetical protein